MRGLITVLFAIGFFSSQSQILSKYLRSIDKIEIIGGPSWSYLRGNAGVDNNEVNSRRLKLGYTFGIGTLHILNENFGLNNEVLIERKGTIVERNDVYWDEFSQSLKEGKSKDEYIYNNFSLALVPIYSFRSDLLIIGIGPFVSYLSNQIVETTFYPQGEEGIENQTFKNKDFEFGCSIQLSFHLPISEKVAVQIKAFNMLGLTNTRLSQYSPIRSNASSILTGIIINK